MASALDDALRQFGATEANLRKAEIVWERLEKKLSSQGSPTYIAGDSSYERDARAYEHLLKSLPKIDGWSPDTPPPELGDVVQNLIDARDVDEPSAWITVQDWLRTPGRELDEYRFKFNTKRMALVREAIDEVMGEVDGLLLKISAEVKEDEEKNSNLRMDVSEVAGWTELQEKINELDVLLGSSVKRPDRWADLQRHLHFAMLCDFIDIRDADWPTLKEGIWPVMYGEEEPLPIEAPDLGELVSTRPRGRISTRLNWDRLDATGFERLLYSLISSTEGYENPDWLMRTNAPDRGRDLSVNRVQRDSLSGTTYSKIIIQAKHWPTKSISVADVSTLKDQVELWEPYVLVIATSGRFTQDAVAWIEQHNKKGVRPKIEMWPESHLERVLARRPDLTAEFNLR